MKTILLAYRKIEDLIATVSNSSEYQFEIIDYYSSYPIKLVKDKKKFSRLSLFAFIGGMIGLLSSLFFQYWTALIDYRINVGGKPFFSLISAIPSTFIIVIISSTMFAFVYFLFQIGKNNKLIEYEIIQGLIQDYHILLLKIEDSKFVNFSEFLTEKPPEYFQMI